MDAVHLVALVVRIVGYGMICLWNWHSAYWAILVAELLILATLVAKALWDAWMKRRNR
jgi:hypothetical protein